MLYQFMMIYIYIYKIRTYGDKVYTNFCGLNTPEDDITFFFIVFFSCMRKRIFKTSQIYRQLSYRIIDKKLIDYLGKNHFGTDED